jgi:hypothetical protein
VFVLVGNMLDGIGNEPLVEEGFVLPTASASSSESSETSDQVAAANNDSANGGAGQGVDFHRETTVNEEEMWVNQTDSKQNRRKENAPDQDDHRATAIAVIPDARLTDVSPDDDRKPAAEEVAPIISSAEQQNGTPGQNDSQVPPQAERHGTLDVHSRDQPLAERDGASHQTKEISFILAGRSFVIHAQCLVGDEIAMEMDGSGRHVTIQARDSKHNNICMLQAQVEHHPELTTDRTVTKDRSNHRFVSNASLEGSSEFAFSIPQGHLVTNDMIIEQDTNMPVGMTDGLESFDLFVKGENNLAPQCGDAFRKLMKVYAAEPTEKPVVSAVANHYPSTSSMDTGHPITPHGTFCLFRLLFPLTAFIY